MGIFKLVGALLLAASGGCCAYVMNQRAVRALKQTEGWLSLLRYIRTQVDCFALPIPRILLRADRSLFVSCGYAGEDVPCGLEQLLSDCDLRDRETEKIVKHFVGEFGKGYREEQLRSCDYYRELLEARRDALADQLPARKRVTSTLWISGALAIIILLI